MASHSVKLLHSSRLCEIDPALRNDPLQLSRTGERKMATPAEIGLVDLTPEDLQDIEAAASKITVPGTRYPEKLEQMTGR
jgi:hypothetical protein